MPKQIRKKKGNVKTTSKTTKRGKGNVSQVVNVYVSKGGGRRRQPAKPRPQMVYSQPQLITANLNNDNELFKQLAPIQERFLESVKSINQNTKSLQDLLLSQRHADTSTQTDVISNEKLFKREKEIITQGVQTEPMKVTQGVQTDEIKNNNFVTQGVQTDEIKNNALFDIERDFLKQQQQQAVTFKTDEDEEEDEDDELYNKLIKYDAKVNEAINNIFSSVTDTQNQVTPNITNTQVSTPRPRLNIGETLPSTDFTLLESSPNMSQYREQTRQAREYEAEYAAEKIKYEELQERLKLRGMNMNRGRVPITLDALKSKNKQTAEIIKLHQIDTQENKRKD